MAHVIADIEMNILQKIEAHSNDITSVEFYGSSVLCTGSTDKTVRIFRWTPGEGYIEESFSPLKGHRYNVTSVKISPKGGVLASASVDGSIILWNIQNGEQQVILYQDSVEAIRCCQFSPNGSIIASGDDSGRICLWTQDKTLVASLQFHEEAVYALAFSYDSALLLSGSGSGSVKLFSVDNGFDNLEPHCTLDNAHDLGVLSADFCKVVQVDPTDQNTRIYTIATCGTDQLIKLWRIYYTGHMQDPDSRKKSRLIPTSLSEHICGSSSIYPTEIMNAECVLTISAHGSSVTCIRFNSTGTLMVSCSLDKSVKIWDLQGNCVKTMLEHSRYVNCVAFNNDSTVIASGSNDRSILIWDVTGSLTLDSHITGMRSILFKFASNQGDVPIEFICPITHEIMKEPVIAEDGFTYEASAIEEWFKQKPYSPMTNLELASIETIVNEPLKERIEKYLESLDFDPFE